MSTTPLPSGLRGRRLKMRALEAFEATSRHMSLTKAAEELGITQAAVSHHIRYLNQELGGPLLSRNGRAVILTTLGHTIARRIQAAFAEINRTIDEATGQQSSTVRLALCSAFAPGWIIKRLSSFYRQYKDIDLQLYLYAQTTDVTDFVADAFILPEPEVAGFWSMPLQHEELVAVHRPSPDKSLAELPIIRRRKSDPNDADHWLEFCGGSADELSRLSAAGQITVSHYILGYEIAKQGAGIALLPDFLVEDDLKTSALRLLSGVKVNSGRTYYFFVKESRRAEPAMRNVVRWLRSHSQVIGRGRKVVD